MDNTKGMEQHREVPLTIEGIPHAPMTAEPDSAELSCEALLRYWACAEEGMKGEKELSKEEIRQGITEKSREYYGMIAKRIRHAHTQSVLRALRFVSFCEQELMRDDLPLEGPESLELLNKELYKRVDTVEREGGDLKQRWKRCLAMVTVRIMEKKNLISPSDDNDDANPNKEP